MNPRRVHELMREQFPPFDASEHEWINIHDGHALMVAALNDLLSATFSEEEVLIEIHRKLGGLFKLDDAAAFVGQHMGQGNIHIADRAFTAFAVVAQNGVATAWRKTDNARVQQAASQKHP